MSGRYNITITLTTTAFDVQIIVHASTSHDIRQIRLLTDAGERGTLSVYGSSSNIPAGPIGTIYQEGSGTVNLYNVYSTGPLGSGIGGSDPAILVDQFGTLHVEGDVLKRIEVSDDSLYSATIDGDLLADIIVPTHAIDSLAVGGSIGAPTSPVNIWCQGHIGFLSCENLYADVDSLHYGGSYPIYELYVQSASESDGNFDGRIHCNYFTKDGDPNDGTDPARFVISGEQTGAVDIEGTLRESVDLGTIDPGATFTVGRWFREYSTIDITGNSSDPKGLKGQIIIDSQHEGWDWDGTIKVDGTTLTWSGNDPGEYTQTAVSLGGGSVGLVPFSTHRESCSPAHGTVKKGAPASITLQFYGPVVQADEGTDMPVRVYRGDYGDDTFANDVDITDDCEVVMHPGGDPRKVRINPVSTQFRPKYRYHLVPITSSPGTGETILLCDGLLASGDVPVKGRDYWVDVDITFGMLDLGGNGWVDTPDVALWAADPVDFNGDSAADSADLQMIVDNLGEPVE